ncbi:SDR family NAD(P)-dependent oxidoreductase [Ferrigenium sp. UT5]|uniref:SDR family NAD(P)-dependent oxidoreductase n=1 Tax=Ferrigenium sp. UT5 TaxID=3242105 RepID=UPI0035535A24
MNPKIKDWHGQRVWLIGASSGIGAALARELRGRGARLALSARNAEALQLLAADEASALVLPFDITRAGAALRARDEILANWGGIDLVLVVAGTYQKMRADDFDLSAARQLVETNLNGTLSCLDAVLPTLLAQGYGAIGIVASVAGLSGLPQALIYGPTKAALINLCESLYLDLRPRGIGVYLINPGFVATTLTANNDFSMPALISAETAAHEILLGIERGAFHIHFPRRFTNGLRVLRLLPYRLYFWLIHKVTGL